MSRHYDDDPEFFGGFVTAMHAVAVGCGQPDLAWAAMEWCGYFPEEVLEDIEEMGIVQGAGDIPEIKEVMVELLKDPIVKIRA